MTQVAIYGADWCGLTKNLRGWLDVIGVKYDYYNVEQDDHAEAQVRDWNGGKLKFPMVAVGDTIMKNPSIETLNKALNEHRTNTERTQFDGLTHCGITPPKYRHTQIQAYLNVMLVRTLHKSSKLS
jgi:mycoredoxin